MLKARLEQLSCYQLGDQVTQTFLRGLLSGLKVDPVRTFLAHLQLTSKCIAKLHYKEWYESLVWKLHVLLPSPVHWHLCAWRLSFQPTSHWSGRWYLGDFSHIWEANPNYMPQGPKEKQHLILKENMWLLPHGCSKNERNAERAAKETEGPHTAGHKRGHILHIMPIRPLSSCMETLFP